MMSCPTASHWAPWRLPSQTSSKQARFISGWMCIEGRVDIRMKTLARHLLSFPARSVASPVRAGARSSDGWRLRWGEKWWNDNRSSTDFVMCHPVDAVLPGASFEGGAEQVEHIVQQTAVFITSSLPDVQAATKGLYVRWLIATFILYGEAPTNVGSMPKP